MFVLFLCVNKFKAFVLKMLYIIKVGFSNLITNRSFTKKRNRCYLLYVSRKLPVYMEGIYFNYWVVSRYSIIKRVACYVSF
jgi:hypothetical protein